MSKEFSLKMNKSKIDIEENPSESVEKKQKEDTPKQSLGSKDQVVKIEIPPRTIITVVVVVIGLYLVVKLLNVFIILFFAMVLASATLPLINGMVRKGFPKWLSITSVYLLLISYRFRIIQHIPPLRPQHRPR